MDTEANGPVPLYVQPDPTSDTVHLKEAVVANHLICSSGLSLVIDESNPNTTYPVKSQRRLDEFGGRFIHPEADHVALFVPMKYLVSSFGGILFRDEEKDPQVRVHEMLYYTFISTLAALKDGAQSGLVLPDTDGVRSSPV